MRIRQDLQDRQDYTTYPVNPVILSKNQIDENDEYRTRIARMTRIDTNIISMKIRLIRVIRVRFKLSLEYMGMKSDNN